MSLLQRCEPPDKQRTGEWCTLENSPWGSETPTRKGVTLKSKYQMPLQKIRNLLMCHSKIPTFKWWSVFASLQQIIGVASTKSYQIPHSAWSDGLVCHSTTLE